MSRILEFVALAGVGLGVLAGLTRYSLRRFFLVAALISAAVALSIAAGLVVGLWGVPLGVAIVVAWWGIPAARRHFHAPPIAHTVIRYGDPRDYRDVTPRLPNVDSIAPVKPGEIWPPLPARDQPISRRYVNPVPGAQGYQTVPLPAAPARCTHEAFGYVCVRLDHPHGAIHLDIGGDFWISHPDNADELAHAKPYTGYRLIGDQELLGTRGDAIVACIAALRQEYAVAERHYIDNPNADAMELHGWTLAIRALEAMMSGYTAAGGV